MEKSEKPYLLAFPWLSSGGLRVVWGAIEAAGGEARVVGGAVRDALLGRPVQDIDLATTLQPEETMAALLKAGIKVVPTGVAHGTVTAVWEGKGYEITTLRRDVKTDGRRAEVAFTDDWQEDAFRRDFTFNALSVDSKGRLYDYVDGQADLAARRVRFIRDPRERIREDVLRLLRFFRFLAQLADPAYAFAPDPAALAACRELAPLLPGLSAERVWRELSRLLLAPDPAPSLRLMKENGILSILLPGAEDVERLARLVAVEKNLGSCDPVRRLAALGGQADTARQLRLSVKQGERLAVASLLPKALSAVATEKELRQFLYDKGGGAVCDALLLLIADGHEEKAAFLEAARSWKKPKFPIQGKDLLARGFKEGPALGQALAQAERWWRENDFAPDKQACLDRCLKTPAF